VKTSNFSKEDWLSHPDTLWKKHVEGVVANTVKFVQELPDSVNQLIDKNLLLDIAKTCALLHDLGKLTLFFQSYIRSPEKGKSELSQHALLAALLTYWIVNKKVSEIAQKDPKFDIIPFIAYMAVRSHHGNLDHFFKLKALSPNQCDLVKKQWDSINKEKLQFFWNLHAFPIPLEQISKLINELPNSFKPARKLLKYLSIKKDLDAYFLTNLLYSILLDADKSAIGLDALPDQIKKLSPRIIDEYREKKGWNSDSSEFNRLRNQAYHEAIGNININGDQQKFALSLPTGFGKTYTSLSIALIFLNSKNLNRIIYCLPFTSIIDQNFEEIKNVLESTSGKNIDASILLKHHYLSDIFFRKEKREYDPLSSQLLMEGWNSLIVVTTFVQFFHTLIGYRNRTLKKFHRMANSIIILDEIQAIPFKYWKLFNQIIQSFSKYFNTYFLLVTATQPSIFPSKEKKDLVKIDHYFPKVNRVNLYLSEEFRDLEKYKKFILSHAKGKKRIIVVFNTIKSAQNFYQKIRNEFDNLYFLSSHIVPKKRLQILKEINQESSFFLVTTQVIEAGVNLDAEIIFRDFAPLDCINQIAGRCNRFAQQSKGEVYIANLVDENTNRFFANYVYDSSLLDLTHKILNKRMIPESEMLSLCQHYFEKISNFPQNESEILVESLHHLRYDNDDRAISTFQLIEQNYEKFDVFIELNEQAKSIWNEYLQLKGIKDFWKRHAKYLSLKNRFQNYIVSVSKKNLEKNPPPIVEDIYYVPFSQLEEYYDPEIGYKTTNSIAIW
jgi:CRISPR-associated endonuclease/helicase Cas3